MRFLLASAGTDLSVDPALLGPLAAFVFLIFTFEIVVPGKAYKREIEENARLSEMVGRILPIAEEMVTISKQMLHVTESVGRALEDFLAFWADEGIRRRSR